MTAGPKPTELEVTLIGPSVGECVVVHFDGIWFIVDSCIDRASGLPAAEVYLSELGVSLDQVRLVLCTHWHDDHFRGIARLYRRCKFAEFWMSAALRRKEFLVAVESWRGWPAGSEPHTSGLSEIISCIDEARSRKKPPNFANQNQILWIDEKGNAMYSLSPSSEMIMNSLGDIAQLIPERWSQKKILGSPLPNNTAVAVLFRVGPNAVLLGADLEEQGDPETGWSAILGSGGRPKVRASLYKVAHHGSVTAHHVGIWTDLLHPNPVSVVTPFSRSGLPTAADIQRVRQGSSAAYISSQRAAAIKRRGAVAKMTARNGLRPGDGAFGRIQCRLNTADPNPSWTTQLQGTAAPL